MNPMIGNNQFAEYGGPTSVPFRGVYANQKLIINECSKISSKIGPPGEQNADLARIIIELKKHTKVLATTAAELEERGRVAANLSSSAQPVLDEMKRMREEQAQMRNEQLQLRAAIDAKCCTIS